MARRSLLFLLILMSMVNLTSASDPERQQIADDLTVREVADGVFIVTHDFPWPANSLVVEMADDSLVLVDTPYTPAATADLFAWMQDHFGQREVIAINTGFHVDNLGGNTFLVENDIPVYGSDLTAELLAERGEASRELTLSWLQGEQYAAYRDAHAEIPFVEPTHLFELETGLDLQVGDETVRIFFPGAGHTADNVVVYFEERALLFGGCMVLAGDQPGNIADAVMDEWADSIVELQQFDAQIIVPGHGDSCDPNLLGHTIELVENAN